MDVKYGRLFKLKNGEQEYIEVSEKHDSSYQRDDTMNYLKRTVEKYHYETELSDNKCGKLHESFPQNSNGLEAWEVALLIAVCSVYIVILQICPMWLKISVVILTISWTIYCYIKKNDSTQGTK